MCEVKDTEIKARIEAVMSVMSTFDFLFCCCLGESILKQTESLNKSIQCADMSAAEGQELASQVIAVLTRGE